MSFIVDLDLPFFPNVFINIVFFLKHLFYSSKSFQQYVCISVLSFRLLYFGIVKKCLDRSRECKVCVHFKVWCFSVFSHYRFTSLKKCLYVVVKTLMPLIYTSAKICASLLCPTPQTALCTMMIL